MLSDHVRRGRPAAACSCLYVTWGVDKGVRLLYNILYKDE